MDDERHNEDHRWIEQERRKQSECREMRARILASLIGWAAIGAASVVVVALVKYLGLSAG